MKFKSPIGSVQSVGGAIASAFNGTPVGNPILDDITEKATQFIKQQARSWFVSTYIDPAAEFVYHFVHGYEQSIDNTLVDLGISNDVIWWTVFLTLMLLILLVLVYISKQSLFLMEIIKSFFFIDYKQSSIVKQQQQQKNE